MMCFLNLRLKKITKIRPLGNTFKYSGDINKILKENKDNSLITIYKASNFAEIISSVLSWFPHITVRYPKNFAEDKSKKYLELLKQFH